MHLIHELYGSTYISECEKTEETLLTSWYPAVTAVFSTPNITKGLKVRGGGVVATAKEGWCVALCPPL